MYKSHRFKVGKLVRDKMPEIMRASGITVFERIMEKGEYIKRLKDKLDEETSEVLCAKSADDLLEELADLLEVIYALANVHGLSTQEVEAKRQIRKQNQGGFEGRVYTAAVEVPAKHPSVGYYRARPDDYPEVVMQ